MHRSIRAFVTAAVFAALLSGGFLWGRALAERSGPQSLRTRRDLSRLLSATEGLGMGDLGFGHQQPATDYPPDAVFEDVLQRVQRDFVEADNVTNEQLTDGALSRLLASFDDPKTDFLTPDMRKARQDALAGTFHGIGAVLDITKSTDKSAKSDVEYHHLTVVDVMPGSPAEKAGLRSGDILTNIDGHWIIAYSILVDYDRIVNAKKDDAETKREAEAVNQKFEQGYSLAKALSALETGEDKPIALTFQRGVSSQPATCKLTTATTVVNPVTFSVLDRHVGYLRVRQFNSHATDEFESALMSANDLRGIVVDLRDNPGGVRASEHTGADGYQSARKLIAEFAQNEPVAMIARKPNQRTPLSVDAATHRISAPVVVLVDGGTANLSEMVASALRTSDNAKIIGSRTFGDDVLQLFAVMKSGGAVELSSAHLLTASGADLSNGIEPDIAVPSTPSDDEPLHRALTALGA